MVTKGKRKQQNKDRQKAAKLQKRLQQETQNVSTYRSSDQFDLQRVEERFSGYRTPLRSFLLVCEGSKTEPQYFESIVQRWKLNVKVVIERGAGDPLCVVKKAIQEKNAREEIDETWAIFDRDSFSIQRLNEALEHAKMNNLHVAFSNEAFEIWYLLHFTLDYTGRSREEYKQILSDHLGHSYEKKDPDILKKLEMHTQKALRYACELENHYEGINPTTLHERNPYTTVHHLLAALLKGPSYPPSVATQLSNIYATMKELHLV